MFHLARRLVPATLYTLWILLVLYPNPTLLPRAISQGLDPQVDAAAVAHLASELPDDPAYIERQVLDRYVPYAVPWQTLGVPWYFPTTTEVLRQGSGDCQSRALVLASILEAKGIPYHLEASFDHIWVSYPTKQPNEMENSAIRMLTDDANGRRLQVPQHWDWGETYRIEKEYFWDYMPASRKFLLFSGPVLIFLRRRLLRSVRLVTLAHLPRSARAVGLSYPAE